MRPRLFPISISLLRPSTVVRSPYGCAGFARPRVRVAARTGDHSDQNLLCTESHKDQKTKRFSNLVFDLRCLICGTYTPHQKSPVTKIPHSAGATTIAFVYITYIEVAKMKLFAVTERTDVCICLCCNISSTPSALAPASAPPSQLLLIPL